MTNKFPGKTNFMIARSSVAVAVSALILSGCAGGGSTAIGPPPSGGMSLPGGGMSIPGGGSSGGGGATGSW